jgi:phosphoglycolate phosphatase
VNARLVVFDWDGTLADSQGKIIACARRALRRVDGPDLDDARLRSAIGL